MVQGLFLYGINIRSNDLPIRMGIQYPVQVLPHAAEPEFRLRYLAVMLAEIAVYFLVIEQLKEHGLSEHDRLLYRHIDIPTIDIGVLASEAI